MLATFGAKSFLLRKHTSKKKKKITKVIAVHCGGIENIQTNERKIFEMDPTAAHILGLCPSVGCLKMFL